MMLASLDTLHVAFRVAGADYLLPASIVRELESYSGVTPVPGAPAHVAGLVQIRGRVMPIVDLRRRFGLPALERSLDQRVIVVEHAERRVGLLVDAAREVVTLAEDAFRPPPELIEGQGEGCVKAVAQLENRLFLVLDAESLLDREKEHVGQRDH